MNDGNPDLRSRVVVLVADRSERALIGAQLEESLQVRVDGAESIRDALAHLLLRAALVIVDSTGQEIGGEEWSRLRASVRGAPILVLARNIDKLQLEQYGIQPTQVLFRPFTVGEVVARAREFIQGE